jgi:hypothetical protein
MTKRVVSRIALAACMILGQLAVSPVAAEVRPGQPTGGAGVGGARPLRSPRPDRSPSRVFREQSRDLIITKEVTTDLTTLDLLKSDDHVTLKMYLADNRIVVTRNGGNDLDVTGETLDGVREQLGGSNAVSAFRVYALRHGQDESPKGEMIRTSDALLGFLAGDAEAPDRLSRHWREHANDDVAPPRWVRGQGTQPAVPAQARQSTCWTNYGQLAVATSRTYEGCLVRRGTDTSSRFSCVSEYLMQIEGRFASYMRCTGGLW